VRTLLRSTRRQAQALWDDVARFNEQHPPDPNRASRVSFYVGQLFESLNEDERAAADDPDAESLKPTAEEREQEGQV
jgi:hypothetical protein